MSRQTGAPIIIDENGITALARLPLTEKAFSENWMQELLAVRPELLPVEELDASFGPEICIGREVKCNVGAIDNLYISPRGKLTIVETKLWRNPEARRQVVAQILDYAKELAGWSYDRLNAASLTYLSSGEIKYASLADMMIQRGYIDSDGEANFIDEVQVCLEKGQFLLLIVGDGIKQGVKSLTEALSSSPALQFQFGLVELEIYQFGTKKMVIPRLLAKTENIDRMVVRVEGAERATITIVENSKDNRSEEIDLEEFIRKFSIAANADDIEVENVLYSLRDMGYKIEIGSKYCGVKLSFDGWKHWSSVLEFGVDGSVHYHPVVALSYPLKHSKSNCPGKKLSEQMAEYAARGTNKHDFMNEHKVCKLSFKKIVEHSDALIDSMSAFLNEYI